MDSNLRSRKGAVAFRWCSNLHAVDGVGHFSKCHSQRCVCEFGLGQPIAYVSLARRNGATSDLGPVRPCPG